MAKNDGAKTKADRLLTPQHQRVNFLFQAALTMAGAGAGAVAASPHSSSQSPLTELAQFYAETMKAIMKKSQVKIHPEMKRLLCKQCHGVLLPGSSSRVRRRKKLVIHTCVSCGAKKRFLADPEHKLAVDEA